MTDGRVQWVGIDWATTAHQVVGLDATGQVRAERVVEHSGAGLRGLTTWLGELAGADRGTVGIAIEVPHGPVVESVVAAGFAV